MSDYDIINEMHDAVRTCRAAGLAVNLSDVDGSDAEVTIDGMPWREWLAAMTEEGE